MGEMEGYFNDSLIQRLIWMDEEKGEPERTVLPKIIQLNVSVLPYRPSALDLPPASTSTSYFRCSRWYGRKEVAKYKVKRHSISLGFGFLTCKMRSLRGKCRFKSPSSSNVLRVYDSGSFRILLGSKDNSM